MQNKSCMGISFVLSYPSLLFVCTITLRACCVHLGFGLGLSGSSCFVHMHAFYPFFFLTRPHYLLPSITNYY